MRSDDDGRAADAPGRPGRPDVPPPAEGCDPAPALDDPGPGVPLPRFAPVAVVLAVVGALGVLGLVAGILARYL